ncbi:hypothetical protein BCR33DRAFT_806574 [Rhizoclosmatium globosum]|uniref:Uncharacterized protein n=1 Tax=Rhizoclosmatium globosum TaxID=329046 RepID=A0A1Y2CN94_9FUNG|nr:hypothetical protein BCR33DRAFT_806574 [Rhizoclosmatium globosum]|eukprot:ORY47815.1 hypothetical protein BCR33DRAFT_806574 [Rhizoclosmatium globosum]
MVVLLALFAVSNSVCASFWSTDGTNEPAPKIVAAPEAPAPVQALKEPIFDVPINPTVASVNAGGPLPWDAFLQKPKSSGRMPQTEGGANSNTPLASEPIVSSNSKPVFAEAAASSSTSMGCYPVYNNGYTYTYGAYASLTGSNENIWLASSGVWEADSICDSSLTSKCYFAAYDSSKTSGTDGTQVNYAGHNFILFKGVWQDLGVCTVYTNGGMYQNDNFVGIAPDFTLWKRDSLDKGDFWQPFPSSVRALDMVQLPDLSFVVVGTDHQLYVCPGLSMWFQCAVVPNSGSVKSIDASPDGTKFIGVGLDNLVYLRLSLYGSWTRIQTAGSVVDITLLLDGSALGTAPDGTLWTIKSPTAPWVKVPNGCCVIRTSLTRTGTILGVGPDNKLYQKVTVQAPWVLVPDSGSVISVSSIKSLPQVNILLGIAADHSLWGKRAESLTGLWQQIPTTVKAIDIVEYQNQFIIVAPDYTLQVCYSLYDSSRCIKVPNSGSVKSFSYDETNNTAVGVGLDNQLYTYDQKWTLVPNSGYVIDIEIRSGTIFGIGTDYNVYAKSGLTAPWKLIPNYCCISRLAILPNGHAGGVGLDNAIYDANGKWNLIANSKSVANFANVTVF